MKIRFVVKLKRFIIIDVLRHSIENCIIDFFNANMLIIICNYK